MKKHPQNCEGCASDLRHDTRDTQCSLPNHHTGSCQTLPIPELLGLQIYNGEKVIHLTVCEIHFTAYLEAGEFPAEQYEGELGSECEVCINEQETSHRTCSICGGEAEHNWEAHYAEFIHGG